MFVSYTILHKKIKIKRIHSFQNERQRVQNSLVIDNRIYSSLAFMAGYFGLKLLSDVLLPAFICEDIYGSIKIPIAEMTVETTIDEVLIKEIKALPKNRIAQVLDFIGYIKQQDARETEKAADTASDDSWFEDGGECPICAKHRDPETGEPLYNAKTIAAIEEGKAMMRGEIPAKWYNSFEEMLEDLDKDD